MISRGFFNDLSPQNIPLSGEIGNKHTCMVDLLSGGGGQHLTWLQHGCIEWKRERGGGGERKRAGATIYIKRNTLYFITFHLNNHLMLFRQAWGNSCFSLATLSKLYYLQLFKKKCSIHRVDRHNFAPGPFLYEIWRLAHSYTCITHITTLYKHGHW